MIRNGVTPVAEIGCAADSMSEIAQPISDTRVTPFRIIARQLQNQHANLL